MYLLMLQESEKTRFGNKLKKEEVFLFQKKMNVSQLLSNSVTNLLKFWKILVALLQFQNYTVTINFIQILMIHLIFLILDYKCATALKNL